MHNRLDPDYLARERYTAVRHALAEDLGQAYEAPLDPSRDLTAMLVPAERNATATIITREDTIVCGQPWVEEVFAQLSAAIGKPGAVSIHWHSAEGDSVTANSTLCTLSGPARLLLTGERTALNFLQTLSGTANAVRAFVKPLEGSHCQLLDTRKTLPGLRAAQKYAVQIGGGSNHRIGLFDAFLIKENHIAACGGIAEAVQAARKLSPATPVEVEVETFTELGQAIDAQADIIMLDEFSDETLVQAVTATRGRAKLEVSGNVSPNRLQTIAVAGIDYVSAGSITKYVRSVDLSMRVCLNNADTSSRPEHFQ